MSTSTSTLLNQNQDFFLSYQRNLMKNFSSQPTIGIPTGAMAAAAVNANGNNAQLVAAAAMAAAAAYTSNLYSAQHLFQQQQQQQPMLPYDYSNYTQNINEQAKIDQNAYKQVNSANNNNNTRTSTHTSSASSVSSSRSSTSSISPNLTSSDVSSRQTVTDQQQQQQYQNPFQLLDQFQAPKFLHENNSNSNANSVM